MKLLLRHSERISNSANIAAQHFLWALSDHGVASSQIPRLIPEIKSADLQTESSLLAVLTPDLLEKTAKFFGVNLKWLEGMSDKIYEYQSCYKQPEVFLELFSAIQSRKWLDDIGIPFRVLTCSKDLDRSSNRYQPLVPVLVEKIADLGDQPIYRYIIFNDGFDWNHEPARIQLKAMARMVYIHCKTVIPLLVVKPALLNRILDRELIPHQFLHHGLVSNPSLEDFALSAESTIAKEVDEFPQVMEYIKEHHLDELFFEKSQQYRQTIAESQALPAASPSIAQPTQVGKRAQNNQDLWEPIRNTVKAWWVEDGDSLHIAKAIARIKTMPHLKAAALSDSAIRKHIADLAPANVRGKSGRKPKKST